MTRFRGGIGPRLNWQIITPVVSGAVLAVGVGLAACFVVAVAGGDGATAAFGVPALVAIPLAAIGLVSPRRLRSMPLRARDGFFAVTLAWLVAAAVGAVPFLLHGTFDRPVDAFFESMSGFTTTGATLLAEIEAEPDAILLWRSLTQWLGGIGIVVLVVAIAPATGLASQRVFYAEISGITAERLTPRIADTAKIIGGLYLALTIAGFAAYWIAGMTPWDAVNHVFTTIATGGFSTRTASIGAFDSLAIELVAIAFMVAGGINFAFYWLALRGRNRIWPQAAEVRAYLSILAVGIAVATVALVATDDDLGFAASLRDAAFTVVSLTTGTGYTTADYDEWPNFARLGLLALMFVGGCAGSTAGGMKVIRIVLLLKTAGQEVQRQLRPKAVQVLRVRGRVFSEEVRRGVLGFFYVYVTVFLGGTLAMAAAGLDPLTAASSVVATLNVVGPGLGDVGATENYAAVPEGGLWVLSALMLIGRLEVFTVLVLLTPAFWRPSVA
ncbi:MAG TPA: TrkH family potassium uptake protein [Solirubrobacteraceae bacterium]|nr:TrkH family potassium uptake protein [Solirubrobacteraceae bacterium]